ncbi:DoxX-like protein [Roseivirga ehrenbergii]|uniref:DoxX family protein n=1 Tax=Roseivirga ehrenbergii (strain DSM 102268 / JCM 13514 / KCTC 12282 / NCIMB 14502 / KMM 6017) TaxID=279360 RepID=A0A150XT45_ROSEK|nr:DoxX family membrane protein [Roseivirga ehrenbergii]KYG81901.1 DoxX family protein [Roseivirga ehrenbergii]TCL01715.1 DoxX-like protein [Roseivirga ehrenbergii]
MRNKKSKKIVSWILRLLAALIMLQTLFFKFSGAEESIYIFKQVGMEPWGRYLTGVVELIAGVFLLTNRYELGALLGLGTISGAIFFHLTKLGVEVQGDGGYLFILAIVVFVSCTAILLVNFSEIKAKYLPNK